QCSSEQRRAKSGIADDTSANKTYCKQLPERELSLIAPEDPRFPLPGNIGLLPVDEVKWKTIGLFNRPNKRDDSIFTAELNTDRYLRVVESYTFSYCTKSGSDEIPFECIPIECPQLLYRDFQELYPLRFVDEEVTLVAFYQKSNDDCESERDNRREVIASFLAVSRDICRKLIDAGYWADFVDPTSSEMDIQFSNMNLLEIRERFRNLAFSIENKEQCKVITYYKWGENSFVGSLFTNAPVDSKELKSILKSLKG
ncbi:methylmalonic aciduria and homocystinuria type D-like protein, partial [Dinothrombium tinctorium]